MPDNPTQYQNRKAIEAFALKYRLSLPERQKATRIGELAGRKTGSSIEYQDRRDYVPGDDLRYIDWRAFARSDRLSIKLYREEISPRVDIVTDTSLSMDVTPEKSLRALDLAFLFYLLSLKTNAAVGVYSLGEQLTRIKIPLDLLAMDHTRQDTPMPLLHASPMARKGGIKIFISDFLFPFSPGDLVSYFSASDRLILVQVLSSFEDDPNPGGTVRLLDAENSEYLDVALNRATIEGYRKRLAHLKGDMERKTRLVQGAFVSVRDIDPMEETVRSLLLNSIIEV